MDRPFTLSVGPGLTKSLTYPGDWTTTLTVALGWSPDERWTFVVAPYWERESDLIEGTRVTYNELSISVGASCSFAPGWTVVSWKISDEEFQVGLNTSVSFDF